MKEEINKKLDLKKLTKEELIKIIDYLNGRLEYDKKRAKRLHASKNDEFETNSIDNYWKQILDALPVSVSLHDVTGYTTLNKFGCHLTGYTEEEWISMTENDRALIIEYPDKPETLIFFDLFAKNDRKAFIDAVELEIKLKTKEGKWLWLYTTNKYLLNPITNDFDIITAAVDITDRKNHELEIERLNNELESLIVEEKKLSEEKRVLLEQQIVQINEELNRMAVNLIERKNFLLNLKDRVSAIIQAKNREIKILANELLNSIEDKLNNQALWSAFEIQFDNANTQFIKNLHKLYPDLTSSEINICSLLKLNLSTKVISSVLNLSSRTVEAHRLSIRKKMNIKDHEQIFTALNSF